MSFKGNIDLLIIVSLENSILLKSKKRNNKKYNIDNMIEVSEW